MLPPPTLLAPRRAAHASIEGYLYQTFLGVERWFRLLDTEVLLCEGDEDLDRLLLDGSGGISEQVKSLTGSVNIRDEVVKGTLRRFVVSHHQLRSTGRSRNFVFTTTATLRPQRIHDLGSDILADWTAAREDAAVRERVVSALRRLLPIQEDEDEGGEFRSELAEALRWLDAAPERWRDLLNSIEWRLGQPDLMGVRRRLLDLLGERGLPPDMLDRLVAEILQASIAPEPEMRLRTRQDLETLLVSAEANLTLWVATKRSVNLRRAIDEITGVRRWLSSRHLDLDRVSPSKLLTANYEVVLFNESGRLDALDALAAFCNGTRKGDLWVVHGDGGLGKTRFLMEGCRRLAAQGWHAGFLDPDATVGQLMELMDGLASRLIVVDYAESRLTQVQALVHRMAFAPLPGAKVRVVLLTRREGDWLKTLRRGAEEIDFLDGRFPSLKLPPLQDEESARWNPFEAAVRTFARYLGLEMPAQLSLPDLRREAYGRPLYLHMAALIAAEGRTAATEEALLEEILDRERRFWQHEIESWVPDPEKQLQLRRAMEPMMAALSLLGGLDTVGCRTLARDLLGPRASEILAEMLVELARRFYAAPADSAWYLMGLEPDLLSEELVRQAFLRDDGVLLRSLELASETERRHALLVLGRLAQSPRSQQIAEENLNLSFALWLDKLAEPALDVAVALGDPIGQILAPRLERQASFELALRLMQRCDGQDFQQSVPLREVALVATHRVYQELKNQPVGVDLIVLQDQLASCATQLGLRLAEVGRRLEAVEMTQEAVDIYRALAGENPKAFLPRLALSLSNLGIRLGESGRLEDALAVAHEAVEIRRRLTEIDLPAFRPELAKSLNVLGRILSRQKRFEEGLLAFREAAAIRRQIARNDPDTFGSDLAQSLTDLALCFRDLGRPKEALDSIMEAEILYRRLAADRPDAVLPDLARSLNSMGLVLSDLSRHQEALAAATEAEEIFRRLASRRPDAFMSDLAECLDVLWMIVSRTGLAESFPKADQDAAETYRSLARRQPELDMLRPSLAVIQAHLSDLLGVMGEPEEAWGITVTAINLLLPFVSGQSSVYQRALLRLKKNYERFTLMTNRDPDHRLLALLDRFDQRLES